MGTPGNGPRPLTPPATTTIGQNAQQQAATRQVIAPPPQLAPPAPKPASRATAAAPAKPAPVRRAAPTERVINDTTAAQTRSADRPVPREQPNLGRLSLPQGSLGYEGKTQLQTYDMSDGRRVPGFENIERKDLSYFGLSLRMPTADLPSPSSSSSWSSSPSSFGSHGGYDGCTWWRFKGEKRIRKRGDQSWPSRAIVSSYNAPPVYRRTGSRPNE